MAGALVATAVAPAVGRGAATRVAVADAARLAPRVASAAGSSQLVAATTRSWVAAGGAAARGRGGRGRPPVRDNDDVAVAVAASAGVAAAGGGCPGGATTAVARGERGWAAVVGAVAPLGGLARDDRADAVVKDAALVDLAAAAAPVAAPTGGQAAAIGASDGGWAVSAADAVGGDTLLGTPAASRTVALVRTARTGLTVDQQGPGRPAAIGYARQVRGERMGSGPPAKPWRPLPKTPPTGRPAPRLR